MPGPGRPSPGLARYALLQAGPKTGEPPVVAIAAGLQAADWRVRVACCRALGQYGLGLGSPADAEAALGGLIHALDDDDPVVREIAVECLYEMKTSARRATALSGRLATRSDSSRPWQVARALLVIATDKTAVIPALIAAIGDEEPAVSATALSSLAELGKEARAAMPAIRLALENRAESDSESGHLGHRPGRSPGRVADPGAPRGIEGRLELQRPRESR